MANREVGGAVQTWCRLFHYLRCVIAGVCVTKGSLDHCCRPSMALRVLKELGGGGKKTHLVLDCVVPCLMCIFNLNLPKWWYTNSMPFLRSSLVPNGNTPSSTYRHCRILYAVSVFDVNMVRVWLQIFPLIRLSLLAIIMLRMGISCSLQTISRVFANMSQYLARWRACQLMAYKNLFYIGINFKLNMSTWSKSPTSFLSMGVQRKKRK